MDMDESDDDDPTVFQKYSVRMNKFLNGPKAQDHIYLHQIEAVKKIKEFFMSHSYTLAVLPTGCGKTGIAVLSAYVLAAKRVLVVTPSVTIKEQMEDSFFCTDDAGFIVQRKVITDEKKIHKVLPPRSKIGTPKDIHKFIKSTSPIMVVNIQKFGEKSIDIDVIPKEHFDLVIVDEAHHYPAATWKRLIDYFQHAKHLFLTATPKYKGEDITYLPTGETAPVVIPQCYKLSKEEAIHSGVIRDVKFEEAKNDYDDDLDGINDDTHAKASYKVAKMIIEYLKDHDKLDDQHIHQAMVLSQTINKPTLRSAEEFAEQYNIAAKEAGEKECAIYSSDRGEEAAEKFKNQQLRTLVVVGKLIEGYDNKNVSVVAIVRNVGKKSRVLFTQFVGRAVRKLYKDDPVVAVVISHQRYKQKGNFDLFMEPEILDEENIDEENIDEDRKLQAEQAGTI